MSAKEKKKKFFWEIERDQRVRLTTSPPYVSVWDP
jgi:hypothetical protein